MRLLSCAALLLALGGALVLLPADEKERKFFTLGATPEGFVRLEWLPGFLICLTIIGLGGGIWIVRRR